MKKLLFILLLLTSCSPEQQKNEFKKEYPTKCIDGVSYEVLPYGDFLRFKNGQTIPC